MIIGYSFPKHQFQSTLPQGERRLCAHFSRVQIFNFNPRSRKGSDIQHPVYRHDSAYFNPRSRKGSDFQPAGKDPFRLTFQSTLPKGERLKSGFCTSPDLRISIHAPARGATPLLSLSVIIKSFQSTLPQGERRFDIVLGAHP